MVDSITWVTILWPFQCKLSSSCNWNSFLCQFLIFDVLNFVLFFCFCLFVTLLMKNITEKIPKQVTFCICSYFFEFLAQPWVFTLPSISCFLEGVGRNEKWKDQNMTEKGRSHTRLRCGAILKVKVCCIPAVIVVWCLCPCCLKFKYTINKSMFVGKFSTFPDSK